MRIAEFIFATDPSSLTSVAKASVFAEASQDKMEGKKLRLGKLCSTKNCHRFAIHLIPPTNHLFN
jgi:hypothetical protein